MVVSALTNYPAKEFIRDLTVFLTYSATGRKLHNLNHGAKFVRTGMHRPCQNCLANFKQAKIMPFEAGIQNNRSICAKMQCLKDR
jgi:hypothetical protein